MSDGRPIEVGILVFPNVQQLDLTGPYEVLASWPKARKRQAKPLHRPQCLREKERLPKAKPALESLKARQRIP